MPWFRKQRDPLSERARLLQKQIATLETQIAHLSDQLQAQPAPSAPSPPPSPAAQPPPAEAKTPTPPPPAPKAVPHPVPPQPKPAEPSTPPPAQPRLRSTALPHGPTIWSRSAPESPPADPVFERLSGNPFKGPGGLEKPPSERPELGVRKRGWTAFWQRLKDQFRQTPAANPRLVSYLAAGSLQGLRPLRYEKRVMRNRFIALVIFLGLVTWWLIVIFVKH